MIGLFYILILALLLIYQCDSTSGCPKFADSLCRCEDLQGGVTLDCSNSSATHVIKILKENRNQLGLIQQLSLRNASLDQIPAAFFSGLFIKKLDLSQNRIISLDQHAFIGMNNVLQELILSDNHLHELPSTTLSPLSTLLRLDLSNNSITDLQPHHALPSLFKLSIQLYDINLSQNKICQVHKSIFDNVKDNIQTINFGRNCLQGVPASAIRGFKNLMALHLHGNNIETLNALSFMNLPSMNLLNLASNRIANIHRQAFLNVPNLRYLYLSENRISEILPFQFASFEQLEMLDFSANQLLQLKTDSFSRLQSLRQLYLGENKISNIQDKVFTNSSIVILVLNSNRMTELKEGMFDGLDKLQQLALKDNKIHSIERNTFYPNPNLAMVDLSYNKLIDVPPATFLTQLNIFIVDLSHNKLLRAPYGAFNRRVKTVFMQENPLVCTEKIHMIQQGVGVFVADSEDKICGQAKSTKNDINPINEPFEAPKSQDNDTQTDSFIQESKTQIGAHRTIIRPLSQESATKVQPNVPIQGLIPIRPINAPSNTRTQPISSDKQDDKAEHLDNKTATEDSSVETGSGQVSSGNPINKNDRYEPSILPFPVPFLKKPVKLSQAFPAGQSETMQTLPPSILVAGDTPSTLEDTFVERLNLQSQTSLNNNVTAGKYPHHQVHRERGDRMTFPTAVIIVCISTVIIVMAAVFVGLCIAKHRHIRNSGGSLSSGATDVQTEVYANAQSAHLNMIYGSSLDRRSMLCKGEGYLEEETMKRLRPNVEASRNSWTNSGESNRYFLTGDIHRNKPT